MSKTAVDANEVPIQELWPVHPGTGQLNPGGLDKVIVSREPGKDGDEVTWVRARRAFRVDHFRDGKTAGRPHWIMEHQVKCYTERG